MRFPLFRLFAFILLVAGITIQARATTYFVATTGNDSSVCSTASAPCLTISHAVTLATSAGDIVQVAAGSYSESPTLSHSGSAGNLITVRGQSGSGCPTTPDIDVNSPTQTHPASTVTLSGAFTIAANYVAIDCFHMLSTGSGAVSVNSGTVGGSISNIEMDGHGCTSCGGGIYFAGVGSVSSSQYASNYTITNNYIHGLSNGMYGACSTCVVTGNEITALSGDEPGTDHDYIDAWGVGTAFRHNYMHANTCNSCNGYDCHMDCIQTWNTTGNGTEVSKNMVFDRNVCFNHHEGVIVQDNAGNGDVSNWAVTNNVFAYGPYDDGSGHLCVAGTVHPWCWVFQDGALGTSNTFFNNTCVDGAEGFESTNGSAQFKNNLFFSLGNDTSIYQTSGATVTGANNLDYATSGTFSGGSFTGDIVNKNPAIVSIGTGSSSEQCIGCNYNIQSTSAAINAGVSTSPTVTVDLIGTPRPQGPAFDIGAYEYIPTTKPAAPTALTGVVH
ncbi:choice-of-anchor Q domain-containing protein [Acidicapsa ligni]|uniref:choice-of-anchor Q domain-containing protein n=1 Tax=Acidicapsa ligni TaxID=542300 RepID=UPI0021DF89C3|nr:choice-of-anchor Q domain-containing protein [Acidicapsa ligni]